MHLSIAAYVTSKDSEERESPSQDYDYYGEHEQVRQRRRHFYNIVIILCQHLV